MTFLDAWHRLRARQIVRRLGGAALNWIKALILTALVLAPIVIAFLIGVLFALVVRMALAAREGFNEGRRLING